MGSSLPPKRAWPASIRAATSVAPASHLRSHAERKTITAIDAVVFSFPPAGFGRAMARSRSAMLWVWIGFIVFILLMLALDLGVFHCKAHVVRLKEALAWSAVWVTMGLSF